MLRSDPTVILEERAMLLEEGGLLRTVQSMLPEERAPLASVRA
jgi:hypothetical protein